MSVRTLPLTEKLIRRFPAFVASKECGDGFAEIAEVILEKRRI
jgi:hypothetical protein